MIQRVGSGAARARRHGRIDHRIQMQDARYCRTAVEYFCAPSGIGQAMTHRQSGVPWKVGIVGLGCGTLAAYGRAGDTEFRTWTDDHSTVFSILN